ncbi:MAG: hypothetical protein IBX67_02125 [Dehalococcoidia bacterium]|nr:hypothetical protein [Dehalococcoidia bacterium]
MRTISGLRRHHCLAGVSTCFLVLALVAVMVSCAAPAPTQYSLTISSTAGGVVTTPGEATYSYDRETVVDLVATPDANYRFVEWTGHVGTIADVGAASTTITVNGNYVITAEFEEVPRYNLAISSSGGGSVTTPGEAIFTYPAGTVVNLVAQAEEGYRFAGWTGDAGTIGDVNSAATTITMNGDYTISANFEEELSVEPMLAAGIWHTVGLKSNGRVVAVGSNWEGQCNVGDWTSIVQVSAGWYHTVGLKSDGTVVAVGENDDGQCDVGGWTDIIQVSAGWYHTVGLKSDGTVVAAGPPIGSDQGQGFGQCDVGGWTDIVRVAAGHDQTVGLKSDGTVVATGGNYWGQCNVGGWTDIVQIAAGAVLTVGLMSDGTVVAVGHNEYGQCDVGDWTDIIQVAAGGTHTVGLKSDGTVVAAGPPTGSDQGFGQCDVGSWKNIVQVSAGGWYTVGLKADGTAIAVGLCDEGQCDVQGWKLTA